MEPAHSGGPAAPEIGPDGRVVSRARRIDGGSIRTFLADHDPPHVCWGSRDGLEIAGVGAAVRITADGTDRFASVRADAAELFDHVDHEGPRPTRPRLLGGFSFENRPDPDDDSVWSGFPAASFILPRLQFVRDGERRWLVATEYGNGAAPDTVEARLDRAVDGMEDRPSSADVVDPSPPGYHETYVHPDREVWMAAVEEVLDRIQAGEFRKLVLATAMHVDLTGPLDVPATLERMHETYPECYRVLVRHEDGGTFFGPPPERLVQLVDGEVRTEALAGSIGRGESAAADDRRADALRTDEKRQHEQRLVVDAIADALSAFGEVTEHDQSVRRLETIQHLLTPISATLDTPTHVLDLVAALHPTPAVGGLPRDAAMAAIRETEAFDRGWYAAPVGWIDAAGDGEFTVAIRTAVASGDHARLFAGNGIVADSDPAEEWAEVKPKFRPVLDELE